MGFFAVRRARHRPPHNSLPAVSAPPHLARPGTESTLKDHPMPGTVRFHRILTTRPEKVYRAFIEADAKSAIRSD